MNRTGWQKLAKARVRDAQVLLKEKRSGCAYYVAGYAVECALKACVLGYVERTGIIFEEKKYAERCWTHNLVDLMVLAELSVAFDADMAQNSTLGENWQVVQVWDETSRYRNTPHHLAKKLYKAITDKADGVLPWIMNRW